MPACKEQVLSASIERVRSRNNSYLYHVSYFTALKSGLMRLSETEAGLWRGISPVEA